MRQIKLEKVHSETWLYIVRDKFSIWQVIKGLFQKCIKILSQAEAKEVLEEPRVVRHSEG